MVMHSSLSQKYESLEVQFLQQDVQHILSEKMNFCELTQTYGTDSVTSTVDRGGNFIKVSSGNMQISRDIVAWWVRCRTFMHAEAQGSNPAQVTLHSNTPRQGMNP